MEKYFLYARKSSESDEKQVQSIDDQLKVTKLRAKSMGITIVDIFTESMSAKAPGRYRFNEMIQRIKKGEARGIISWKLDRLTRNPIDTGTIQYMLQTGDLDIISTNDRDYFPVDSGLLFSVETGMANQYILDLIKNVNRGMNSKYEKGIRPTNTPLGYLNDKNERTIIDDPKRFHIIRKMWDLMITGDYSGPEILDIANNKWGLRSRKTRRGPGKELSRAGIYRIFKNIFYTGYFHHNGELKNGIHSAMVTLEEFDRVQEILGKKGSTRPKNYEFSYTGMIKCGECGNMITAERKTKYIKSTGEFKTYTYYHCTNRDKKVCGLKRINLEEIELQIICLLNKIEIVPEFKNFALKLLKDNYSGEVEKRIKQLENINIVISREEIKLKKLTDLLLEEMIDNEEYKERKGDFIESIERIKQERDKIDISGKKNLELTEKVFEFSVGVQKVFNDGDLKKKKEVLSTLGQNFIIKDGQLALDIHLWFNSIMKSGGLDKFNNSSTEPQKNSTSSRRTNAKSLVFKKWSETQDSNLQPRVPKTRALPIAPVSEKLKLLLTRNKQL